MTTGSIVTATALAVSEKESAMRDRYNAFIDRHEFALNSAAIRDRLAAR